MVYTGELQADEIANLRYAFYIKEKNDPDGKVVAVGTVRQFKNQNALAKKVSNFRIAVQDTNELYKDQRECINN